MYSCFRWDWTSSSSDYYLDPVVLRLSESSLCRGYHENRLIPGSTDHTGRCAVGFFGRVYKLDKYQVRCKITQPTGLFNPSVTNRTPLISYIHGPILKPFGLLIVISGWFCFVYHEP